MRPYRIAGLATLGAALALGAAACSLDVTNPNAAPREEVFRTPAGLRALAAGAQGRLGNALEEGIWIPGLVSGELGNTLASLSQQREFQSVPAGADAAIQEVNIDLVDLWSKFYQVVRSADDILENVDVVPTPGTASGMTALAKTLKAISFGTLIESFQQIPIETAQEDAPFASRAEVLQRSLDLLASARADLTAQAPSTEFTGQVLAPRFDLPNTIRAMQARYSLAAGSYEAALAFANEVPATAISYLGFTNVDQNPLWGVFTSSRYFAARTTFRDNAEAGDTRVNRFTKPVRFAGFATVQLDSLAIYKSFSDSIPLFTQDELTLIRAEAHARGGRLQLAIDEINIVRQRAGLTTPKTLVDLPTEQAVLDEVYRQRTYSLFALGMRWADQRRFGRLAEAKVAYLPYPFSERATNPSTPANP